MLYIKMAHVKSHASIYKIATLLAQEGKDNCFIAVTEKETLEGL